jgi:hypothetical protein
MATLTTLTAHPPAHTFDPSLASASSNTQSIFSSFLPNFQGQGPVGSAFRIILRLQQHTARRIADSFGKENLKFGYKKKEDDMRDKAVKVIDLLQHSAELGNMDALYTLSQLSLVCILAVHVSVVGVNPLHIRFLLRVILYRTQHWHFPLSILMHKKLEMQHRKPILPSSTVQDITELYQLIKQKLSSIILLLQTEETRGRRWPSGTVTGAGLELVKAANVQWGGMKLLQRRASK